MKCHTCGSELRPVVTSLPFKVGQTRIIILKDLPVLQCENCTEYLIEDKVMEKVKVILKKADKNVELEIIRYAA